MAKEHHPSIVLFAGVVIVLTASLLCVIAPTLIPSSLTNQETRVYYVDRISKAHREIIDRFNQLHKGRIEVVGVDFPFEKFRTNERKELLARSLRSKSDKLDVFSVDQIWVQRFSRWCEPLDRYFSPEERANIFPAALQSCFHDSTLVAMPLYIDIGLLYYREDLIQRLPDAPAVEERLRSSMTWPEFLGLRQRLGYTGKPFYIFQADAYEGLVCNYLELVEGKNRSALSPQHIRFDTPAARSALQFMVDLVHTVKAAPLTVTQFDEPRSYKFMLDSDAVFLRGWPSFVESFRLTHPDTSRLNRIRKAALPHFEGMEPTSLYGGWNLMLSTFSSRKPEAVEFIRFLGTKEAQEILYESEGFLPVSNAIYTDSVYMRTHPELAYLHTLLERGFYRPSRVDYTRISDILSHYVHRAIQRDLTVDTALREASDMIKAEKVLIK